MFCVRQQFDNFGSKLFGMEIQLKWLFKTKWQEYIAFCSPVFSLVPELCMNIAVFEKKKLMAPIMSVYVQLLQRFLLYSFPAFSSI
jgi:hypothetical protein